MSVATTTALTLIGTGVAAGTTAYSAHRQSSDAEEAGERQADSIDRQIAWERERDERDREEHERTEAENQRRWEVEMRREQDQLDIDNATRAADQAFARQQWDTTERGRAPYRQVGSAALHNVANELGITVRPTDQPPGVPRGGRMSDLGR